LFESVESQFEFLSGKAKPLKQPKKEARELDESDLAFMQKKKEEAAALKAMQSKGAHLLKSILKFSVRRRFRLTHLLFCSAKGGGVLVSGGIKMSKK
jgi:hypothetical protein